jgi:tetratricopeptide (TPR) repeat protein
MREHRPILRVLLDCLPPDLFTGPDGAPAPDLLPELAGHLRDRVGQAWGWGEDSALAALLPWADLVRNFLDLTDCFVTYGLAMETPGGIEFQPKSRYHQAAFFYGVLLGLWRFAGPSRLLPISAEDWLAILPPRPVPFHGGDEDSVDLVDDRPWALNWRGELRMVRHHALRYFGLASRVSGVNVADRLARRRETLGDLAPPGALVGMSPYILEGSPADVPLTDLIRRQARGRHSRRGRDRIALLRAACDSLRPLHERGLAHGDLRPACLVLPAGEATPPRVIARGALEAALVQDALERQRNSKRRCILVHEAVQGEGSMLMASPQVLRGQPATPADDVYSLATITLQLFTGDLLAGRPGGSSWRDNLLQRDVPPWLVDLLATCWADAREDRPRDAIALADRLDDATAATELVFLEGPVLENLSYPEECLQRVQTLLAEKQYDLAFMYAERAIQLEPTRSHPLYWRARCYFARGDYEAAIEDCTRAVRKETDDYRAWELRGAAHVELGQLAEAVADLTRAILALPTVPLSSVYAHRGEALFRLGRMEEAFADCEEALRIRHENVLALTIRGEIARREDRFAAAIADCSVVLDHEPENARARRTRALAHARHGDYSAALADFAISLLATPEDVELLLARAEMLFEWQHFAEAAIGYECVLRLDQRNAVALAGQTRTLKALSRK